MPFNHLILCRPLLLLPSIFPSIRVFSNESVLHIRWPKYWSFSFNISPSKNISFRIDWLDLLAVQGTLASLLQHHCSKASILWRSAFFVVHLSHPYMTTGKTIALTRQTFVGKVLSLLLNMLSRLVITFLPRSKRLLISWLQLPSAVIFGAPQNKVSHCFPIYLPWSDDAVVKNQPVSAEDMGSIPDPGRSHMPRTNQVCVPRLLRLCSRAWEPQLLKPAWPRARAVQQGQCPATRSCQLQPA